MKIKCNFLLEFDYHSDECNKWKSDGFKCVNAVDCEDGYFDNVGGVPAIRGDNEEYLDINEASTF